MQFEQMGNLAGRTLMLLPGTGCTWQINFKNAIEDLKKEYYLICVNYDGFEGDPSVIFEDMLSVTQKIEDYILKNFNGKLDGAYGSSLGGSFLGLLVQRQRVHIDHAFLGGSDLDQSGLLKARMMTTLVSPLLKYFCSQKGQKKLAKLDRKMGAFMEEFSCTYNALHPDTLKNQFYSDLITPLEKDIHVPETAIHIIYAKKMGRKYEKRYKQHFQNPDIHPFDMQHEGWMFDTKWVKPVLETIAQCMEEPL